MIEIKTISKAYDKKPVLDNIEMVINDGEIVSIIGRNGSGKSTLLSILAGVLRPNSGQVFFDGNNISNEKTCRNIGFVAQYDKLFEELTVKDNIKFWASAAKNKLKDIKNNQFIKLLELEKFQNKKISSLSGGMKKRVSICISLINNPDYIIMDEPFSGLDLFYKQELINCLKTLKNMGKTIIYTSHNSDEILEVSDSIYIIDNCKIVFFEKTSVMEEYGVDFNKVLINLIKGDNYVHE